MSSAATATSGLGPVDMKRSIVKSSNVYYYSLANEMGVDLMHDQLEPFGFGRRTDIDLDGEVTGLLPSTAWKQRAYKRPEQQRWYAGETISLGIGQGYNNFTMLQLASATATLAAGGQRFKPRLVREIEDAVSGERRTPGQRRAGAAAAQARACAADPAGAGRRDEGRHLGARLRRRAYRSGGKTGTAQAVSDRARTRSTTRASWTSTSATIRCTSRWRRSRRPTVALAVVVENAGFGSAAAAPIARRVFDYLLLGWYPARRTSPPRSAARAARRSARRGRRRPTRCRASRPARRFSRHEGARMTTVFEQASLWRRAARACPRLRRPAAAGRRLARRDRPGGDVLGRLRPRHALRRPCAQHALALAVLFVVAQVPPQRLMQLAVPLYVLGVALLVATALFGVTKKGATRWLDLGIVIQPTEMMKIAMPLMLAWWFQKREGQLRVADFVVAGADAAACRWR